jgi:hypothetical protein
MRRFVFLALVAALIAVLFSACKDKLPPREYIEVIKNRLHRVQEAVKLRGRNGIDSLLTESYAQDSGADSLVQFVNGGDPTFKFATFSKAEIYYTDTKARIDCLIIGEDGRILRSATLTFERKKDQWLLKQIAPGMRSVDSIQADSVL